MKILKYPHEALTKKASPITLINADIVTLAGEMLITMDKYHGIGLAATQVGKELQMFVINTKVVDPNGVLEVFVNPKIINKEGSASAKEGCLSFNDRIVVVKRAEKITVEYTTLNKKQVTKEFSGITARCILHEYDHLLGITMVDYEDPQSK